MPVGEGEVIGDDRLDKIEEFEELLEVGETRPSCEVEIIAALGHQIGVLCNSLKTMIVNCDWFTITSLGYLLGSLNIPKYRATINLDS